MRDSHPASNLEHVLLHGNILEANPNVTTRHSPGASSIPGPNCLYNIAFAFPRFPVILVGSDFSISSFKYECWGQAWSPKATCPWTQGKEVKDRHFPQARPIRLINAQLK